MQVLGAVSFLKTRDMSCKSQRSVVCCHQALHHLEGCLIFKNILLRFFLKEKIFKYKKILSSIKGNNLFTFLASWHVRPAALSGPMLPPFGKEAGLLPASTDMPVVPRTSV